MRGNDPETPSPASISRRRLARGLGPLVWCVALFAVLLAAWSAIVDPFLPEQPRRMRDVPPVVWSGEDFAVFIPEGDLERADLLCVGDSRVQSGVLAGAFEDAGFGETALLWGPGAQSEKLLRYARTRGPRRIVLAVSPAAVHGKRERDEARNLLEFGPGPFDTAELEAETARFRELARRALVAAERDLGEEAAILGNWWRLHQHAVEEPTPAQRVDAALSEAWREFRADHLQTLTGSTFGESWFHPLDPTAEVEVYERGLRRSTREERSDSLARLCRLVAELRADGVEFVAVRLPISPQLLAVEEAGLPAAEFEDAFRELGVPYLDYSRADYTTTDGSHLTDRSARRFSHRLAREVAALTGWTER